jgi:hypothetical protein
LRLLDKILNLRYGSLLLFGELARGNEAKAGLGVGQADINRGVVLPLLIWCQDISQAGGVGRRRRSRRGGLSCRDG